MKKIVFLLTISIGIFYTMPNSWAVDPNINTASTDLRSSGADGSPGFNPCLGGTRSVDGVCGGAVGATALLSPATLTLFSQLGPGAVTDNMFGIIDRPASPGTCAAESTVVGANGLNCGNARWNPATQLQSAMTDPNTLTTTAPVNMNNVITADFCANAATDCPDNGGTQQAGAHVGFNVINNFSWNQTSSTTADVVSSQTMEQVTGVKTTCGSPPCIGTRTSPGVGDQRVIITTAFSTSSSNNSGAGGSAVVNWTQTIEDPDQSGTGGSSKFTQTIAGSFTYNAVTTFPTVQYPDGKSMTNGDIASANLP